MNRKIDFKALTQKIKSKWYIFVFTLVVTVSLALLYINYTQPVYLVRSAMMLNTEIKTGGQSEKFLKEMELFTPKTEIEDEIGILTSYDLLRTTLNKLDFGISYHEAEDFTTHERYGNFPFTVEIDSSATQLVDVPIYISRTSAKTYVVDISSKNAGTYNFKTGKSADLEGPVDIHAVCFNDKPYENQNLKFKVKFNRDFSPIPEESAYYFIIHDLNSLAESYLKKLEVKPITRESNIVEMNLKGKVPPKEVIFMNTLMEVYVTSELQKRHQLGLKTIEFIDNQLTNVSEELKQTEGSLESFRSRKNILDISTTAENLTRNLDKLEDEKQGVESKLKFYQSIARALERGSDLKNVQVPSTFGLEDPLLNDLIMELSRLSQERTQLNYTTKEGNPVAEMVDMKIANHKKALLNNVNNFIDASGVALGDLNRQIQTIKNKIGGLPSSERELVNIQRKFEFNDNVYNYLLEKRAEAGIAIASNMVEKRIIDRAKQVGREPVFPNKRVILLLAFFGGLGVAFGLIIVNDVLKENIVTVHDVESSTKIPFIGSIVHGNRKDRAMPIVAHSRTELGESFRTLRVNLQYLGLNNGHNVIGVTSSIVNEGKTFCSVNLAATIALAGRKTIIIDADMRKPKVASVFKIKKGKGLSNFLSGNCDIQEIISRTNIDKLDVITSGPIPNNPLDLIGHPKMEELINQLKQSYNTVVIDSPPIGFVSEYIILMKYTTTNLYIVRSNYTSRFHLQKINRLYKDRKIQNVSILLNDAKPSSVNGYYYGYS